MLSDDQKILAVPTNIITGFLGVGKTTAILNLLRSKPAHERWAVLVNEFGEVGIDGSLFSGQYDEKQGVFIREVPGGCMCCSADLPMQVALNQLLSRAKPDRLLIEPTGLGHPKEVLQVLSADYYKSILDLQKTLTLVDARNLSDKRYTEHETFNQQIAIADIVIGNKTDLYVSDERSALEAYVKKLASPNTQLQFTSNGKIMPSSLMGNTSSVVYSHNAHHHHHHTEENKPLLADMPIPASGYLKAVNEGEGFFSIGWRFSPNVMFHYKKLFAFLSGIKAERMKAVFITENGIFSYNLTLDALTEVEQDDCLESRVEIIADEIVEEWESELLACRLDHF